MSYVNISPEELLRVCNQCLHNIETYNGEDDVIETYKEFSLLRLRYIKKQYTLKPTWTYTGVGITTRLEELKSIAENVINDTGVEDRDIKLSLTTHNELYKLLNKSGDFQPYIFGNRY